MNKVRHWLGSLKRKHSVYRLNEKGELEYTLFMETPETSMAKHVEAVFTKDEALRDIQGSNSP